MISTAKTNEMIVYNKNSKAITNSLIVAQQFKIRHSLVVKNIRKILENFDSAHVHFEQTEFKDVTGRQFPMFEMNREGFMYLLIYFSGKKLQKCALDFYDAFENLSIRIEDELLVKRALQVLRSKKINQDTRYNREGLVFLINSCLN